MDTKHLTFPFTVVGAGRVAKTFASESDLGVWATEEARRGKLLAKIIPDAAAAGKFKTLLYEYAERIESAVNRLQADGDKARDEIAHFFVNYASGLCLILDSDLGSALIEAAPYDAEGVVGAILQLTSQKDENKVGGRFPEDLYRRVLEKGAQLLHRLPVVLGDREMSDRLQEMSAQIRTISQHLNEAEQRAVALKSEMESRWNSARIDLERFPLELRGEIAKAQQALDEQVNAMAALVPETKQAAEAALVALRAAFHTQQSLDAPTEYWAKKYADHKEDMKTFAKAGLGAAAGVIFVGLAGWLALDHFFDGVFHWWMAGLGVVYGTLAFWLLRILSRLFFSAQHLMEDAREREVMTRGLFALAADAQASAAVKTKPISSTIDILFRPAPKGIIDDQAPGLDPNRLIDAIGRLSKKK